MNEQDLGADTALRDELIATASELRKCLVEHRELEQKRWTRSVATIVLFVSMGLTYIGVHAISIHYSPPQATKKPVLDLQRVHLAPRAIPAAVSATM